MTNTEIASQLSSLAKRYAQIGNQHYSKALRSQSRQAAKGVDANWSGIIVKATEGLR